MARAGFYVASKVRQSPEWHPDEILVDRAKVGDGTAFVELCRRHSGMAMRIINRILRNDEDTEDVLQEATLKAYLHLNGFDGRAKFSTWFTRIAVNSALMLLRKRRGVLEISIDKTGEVGTCSQWDHKDSRDNPEQCFERQQRANLIHSAILQLPPALCNVVELQYLRELSNKEIARCLGISLAATKSRLLRARTALRVSVQREARKSHAGAESVRAKQPASLPISGNDFKASPTRRQSKTRSSPEFQVPVKLVSPTWKETIPVEDEELSMVGGR
jgi:RNA polymerase sigma factor (sigma-70 family)